MKEVFIVIGRTGNYEDSATWMAFAVQTELDAIRLAEKLNIILRGHKVCRLVDDILSFPEIYKRQDELMETIREQTGDNKFLVDDGGTYYYYEKVDFRS